ncbi:MAG: ABC transporter ATP-binding protein [Methylococcaceae bacterium]|nr:ABC transporter ATP-binding protein [Methylococcaceae bacterium]
MIEVNHLTKEYQLGHITSLRDNLLNTFKRLGRKPVQQRESFKALDDVDFKIEQGEVVGIIGHSGAGKSTLLKHLAHISNPTKGKVIVRGSIAPLIEVGAGVNPEMTGRENIFLNGAILGIPKKIIQQKLDEIIEFSELEQFIDTPVKRYSSGMTVKLGFSIATSLDADILIIDEVLAVGDMAFQRKCFDKMEDMINRQGKTVLLVSHNIRQVERLCNRVILMDHGKIFAEGDPTEVCNLFFNQSNEKIKANVSTSTHKNVTQTDDMLYKKTIIYNNDNNDVDSVECLSPMRVIVHFDVLKPLKNICFLIGVHTPDFLYLTATNSIDEVKDYLPGEHQVEMAISSMTLLPGVYSIRVWIGTPEGKVSFYAENLKNFTVVSEDHLLTRQQEMGLFYLDAKWRFDAIDNAIALESA